MQRTARRVWMPALLLTAAAGAVVASLLTIRGLPEPSPPKWSGPVALRRVVTDAAGRRVAVHGHVQVEMRGRFYLTGATVTLVLLPVQVKGTVVADPAAHRELIRGVVWEYLNDPDSLGTPPQVGELINAAVDAPGVPQVREFGEQQHADRRMLTAVCVAVAGGIALLVSLAWVCLAARPSGKRVETPKIGPHEATS